MPKLKYMGKILKIQNIVHHEIKSNLTLENA
jgi:hypothetical protein